MWCIGKLRICLCFTSPIHCHPLSSFPSTVFCVFGCILYLGIVPDTEFPRKRRVNCHCSILPIFFKFVCLASPIFGLVIATPWLQLLRVRNSSYHTGYYVPYSFRTMFGFSKIQQNLFAQRLWDGAYGLSSLSVCRCVLYKGSTFLSTSSMS